MTENSSIPRTEGYLKVASAYGVFMMSWAVMEGVIQAGIRKELGISAIKTVIITGKMQFNPRAQLLIGLLKLHGDKHKEAITLLNKIEGFAKRNSIVHGMIGMTRDGKISFSKYDGGASTVHIFNRDDIANLATGIAERTIRLRDLLELTDQDSQEISNATVDFARSLKKE